VRVLISGTGKTVQVRAESGLSVTTWNHALSTTGISWYRLIADSGSTETLQAYKTASKVWANVATKLPEASAFTRGWYHSTRVRLSDGSESRYFGQLRAIRRDLTGSADGVGLVNVVTLDDYTRGVTPREMPASWEASAVHAQAVAARTYGWYAVQHPKDPDYDICDTTACQVYGGYAHYASDGTLLTTDDPDAVVGNSGQVLTYKGATIFSQFSASNGGWTVSGGTPYMVAKADPYDSADGTDPYTLQSKTLKLSSLAASFGLKTLSAIAVTQRDGNGAWGGRVLAGYVTGTTSAGKTAKVTFDGFDLQSAVGAGTTWLAFSKPTP
jgi:SpoIID/LytB domain protein